MMIERGWTSLAMTNWCGAWRGTDFSPVVIKKEEVKAELANGDANGHAVPPAGAEAMDETSSSNSPAEEDSTEPAGTVEGALRMEPEILSAKPVVLGHSLQRHIKLCRCKLRSKLACVLLLTI